MTFLAALILVGKFTVGLLFVCLLMYTCNLLQIKTQTAQAYLIYKLLSIAVDVVYTEYLDSNEEVVGDAELCRRTAKLVEESINKRPPMYIVKQALILYRREMGYVKV